MATCVRPSSGGGPDAALCFFFVSLSAQSGENQPTAEPHRRTPAPRPQPRPRPVICLPTWATFGLVHPRPISAVCVDPTVQHIFCMNKNLGRQLLPNPKSFPPSALSLLGAARLPWRLQRWRWRRRDWSDCSPSSFLSHPPFLFLLRSRGHGGAGHGDRRRAAISRSGRFFSSFLSISLPPNLSLPLCRTTQVSASAERM